MKREPTTFLNIETALADRLLATWRPLAAKIYAEMRAEVKQGNFDKARELANKIDLSEVGDKNREWIKYMLYAAARFGAEKCRPDATHLDTVPEKKLNDIADAFIQNMTYQMTARVRASAVQSIALAQQAYVQDTGGASGIHKSSGLDNGLGHRDQPLVREAHGGSCRAAYGSVRKSDDRFVEEFVSFADDGDALLQMQSSLHTSRLATWGFTGEAQAAGVTRYRLNEQHDNRTCPLCDEMDGREFDVAAARSKVEDQLSVDNPSDLANTDPFPGQSQDDLDRYKDMSDDDMQASGMVMPPFHPYCRGTLENVATGEEVTEPDEGGDQEATAEAIQEDADQQEDNPDFDPDNPQDALTNDYEATQDSFQEMGLDVSQDEVDKWNDSIGIAPALAVAMMTGLAVDAVMDGVADLRAFFGEEDEVGITADDVPVGEGDLDTQSVYDPDTGTLYQNYAEFSDVDPEGAAEYLADLGASGQDLADTIGATTMTAAVNADNAAALVGAGYLPDQGTWDTMRADILSELGPDGKFEEVRATLSEDDFQALTDLLNSDDPKSLWGIDALADYVNGDPLLTVLLVDADFEGTIDLTDQDSVQRYEATYA